MRMVKLQEREYGADGNAVIDHDHHDGHPGVSPDHDHKWSWDGDKPKRGSPIPANAIMTEILFVGGMITVSIYCVGIVGGTIKQRFGIDEGYFLFYQ